MATTNHYDLIVLGDHVAGLVAAALVARRGKRVLVIPQGPIDGHYRLNRRPFALDPAPVIHASCPAVRRVFEELGLWTQSRRELRPMAGMMHWALAGARLDEVLASTGGAGVASAVEGADGPRAWTESLADEAAREWPGVPAASAWALRRQWADATDALFDELLASDNALVADGFWARRFLGRVASQLPPDNLDELEPLPAAHPLRAQARALEPWVQHLAPAQLGKAASLRIAGLWGRPGGPLDRPGGVASLREQLIQRIQLKSGEVKPKLRVAEVLIKRGRVTGVSLLGKRDRYGCDHMLIACDPRRLLDGALVPETLPKPLLVSLAAIHGAAYRYLLHLDLDARGLGPGLEGLTVCLPASAGDYAAKAGVGTTYVRVGDAGRSELRSVAIVRVVGPSEDPSELRERVLDDLEVRGVLPFARPWIRLMHSPHDGRGATDGEGRALASLGSDTALSLPMDPLYAVDGAVPSLGVGLLPHSSGVKNLHFASRLTYPGLGLEGEFTAAWAAAGAVAQAGRSGLGRNLFLGRGNRG